MTRVLVMYSTHRPSDGHIGRLRDLGCEVDVATDETHAIALADQAEVIFGHRYLRQCLPHAPKLRWVQSTAGGVDRLPLQALTEKSVTLTRSTCMSGVIARHAHTSAWALTRGLPDFVAAQSRAEWQPARTWLPFPRQAMVLGRGTIGRELVSLLKRDELSVISVNRSTPDWPNRLPDTDWIFIALPSTPTTKNLVDRRILESLPSTALVILAGRAETIDLTALCALLEAGRLGGAAIDLLPDAWEPAEHPVWRTPRLLITPHAAAHAVERGERHELEFENQMQRYLKGMSLENLVGPTN